MELLQDAFFSIVLELEISRVYNPPSARYSQVRKIGSLTLIPTQSYYKSFGELN